MNMTMKTRHAGAVTIVDIRGRIVLGEECTSLAKLVSDLLGTGHNKILLNLADVHRVDTAGLAYIMAGLTSARKHNGELKLLNPAKQLQDVLEITRMLSVLEISNDEAAAVKSFTESAGGAVPCSERT
jgi:anti-sigma B factor antagonist